ncbi:hypothetical protein WR25_11496 [Diploscapter pachys]|uniref:C-type lectin domain-containing protein n=1 Tax=Diploscapter pachys TaxID=2018661 RepID=A0A2A2L7K5_9BILA|nr:hypothetical protein WR25_11496 [Diploscapter pachys]
MEDDDPSDGTALPETTTVKAKPSGATNPSLRPTTSPSTRRTRPILVPDCDIWSNSWTYYPPDKTLYGTFVAEAASTIPPMNLVPSPVNEMVHRVPRQQASTLRNIEIISLQVRQIFTNHRVELASRKDFYRKNIRTNLPTWIGLYYNGGILRWLDGSAKQYTMLSSWNLLFQPRQLGSSALSDASSPGNTNNGVEVVFGLTWNVDDPMIQSPSTARRRLHDSD